MKVTLQTTLHHYVEPSSQHCLGSPISRLEETGLQAEIFSQSMVCCILFFQHLQICSSYHKSPQTLPFLMLILLIHEATMHSPSSFRILPTAPPPPPPRKKKKKLLREEQQLQHSRSLTSTQLNACQQMPPISLTVAR